MELTRARHPGLLAHESPRPAGSSSRSSAQVGRVNPKQLIPLRFRVAARDWLNGLVERNRLLEHAIRQHGSRPTIIGPPDRVLVDPGAAINDALLNVHSGRITIERNVIFGHRVCVLTGSHDASKLGSERHDYPRSGYDVLIAEGAWVATNATILAPCRIGRHAVVAAGAVVTRDVEDYAVVAGVPAKPIRSLRGARGS